MKFKDCVCPDMTNLSSEVFDKEVMVHWMWQDTLGILTKDSARQALDDEEKWKPGSNIKSWKMWCKGRGVK